MFPSVCSRLPNGRWAADMVAASSRQYEAPVMPQSMITNVTAGGSAIIHRGPASKPARRASPRFEPARAACPPETTGWVLGEVTARCLPEGLLAVTRHYATGRRRVNRQPATVHDHGEFVRA